MSNKTQSRLSYLSKRVSIPTKQIHFDNVPDLSTTPLRKKSLGVTPKMIHIDLIPSKQDLYP